MLGAFTGNAVDAGRAGSAQNCVGILPCDLGEHFASNRGRDNNVSQIEFRHAFEVSARRVILSNDQLVVKCLDEGFFQLLEAAEVRHPITFIQLTLEREFERKRVAV